MHLIYIFFIALANNVDNISVRIAYSIRGIQIPTAKNLWISVITFIFSASSSYLGIMLSSLFSKKFASILSMIILVIMGLWIIIEPYYKGKKNADKKISAKAGSNIYDILKEPENADTDNSKDIDFEEATLLGIALSINNIGGSLSAGMIGLNSIFIGLFCAAISFAALWSGNYVTKLFQKFNIGNKAGILAGILLIAIGIKQVI